MDGEREITLSFSILIYFIYLVILREKIFE